MDKLNVGIIDYKTFELTISKRIFQDETTVESNEDEFEWVDQTIFNIREFFKNQRTTWEDAFRSLDKDFDGFVSKSDIKSFLIDVLEIKEDQITPERLNRLFKLMD